MRTHRKYAPFVYWRQPEQLREVVQLRNLVSARLEPVVHGLRGGALLDLVFSAGERVAVMPLIEIAPEMLVQREMSPFIWPHEPATVLGDDVLDPIESALLPWIESMTIARQLNAETSRAFGDREAVALVAAARDAGFIGAASYASVIAGAAPYFYALRYAQDRRVALRDSGGAFGAALLERHAREVHADLEDADLAALAQRWFGCSPWAIPAGGRFDVAIHKHDAAAIDAAMRIVLDAPEDDGTQVYVATPVPLDVMLSFDAQDAPPCRSFAVHVPVAAHLRKTALCTAPQPSGGSTGRILMAMREDFLRAPDADTDEAAALANLLRAEGFTVDVCAASHAVPASYDLLHAFTISRVNEIAPAISAAQTAGVPIVLSGLSQDVSAQGAWGTGIVRAVLRASTDETDLEDNLTMVAARRLDAPGLNSKRQEPFAGYDAAVRQVLAGAGAVIAGGAEEEALARAMGYGGPVVVAHPAVAAYEGAVAAPPVSGDFVFAHAPIEARSNLLLLVRAAGAARLPLVIAGPLTEPEYAAALKEQAWERVVLLAEPELATAEVLYRTARVYADVAWVRLGSYRLLRAAASGAAVLTTADAHMRSALGDEGVWEADPGSQQSIALGLSQAWSRRREHPAATRTLEERAGSLCEPGAALVGAVQAYAAAQKAREPA